MSGKRRNDFGRSQEVPRKRGSHEPGRSRREPHRGSVLRYTQSGKAVANAIVAVSHRSKANGEWQDVTNGFFTVSCWNLLADNAATSRKKGPRVVVTGKLIQRTFETDGDKPTVIEIQANHVAAELSFATVEVTKTTNERQEQPA